MTMTWRFSVILPFRTRWVRPSDHPNPNHVVGRVLGIVPAIPKRPDFQESPWVPSGKSPENEPLVHQIKNHTQLKSGKSSESHPPLFFWEVQNLKFPGFFFGRENHQQKNSSAVWLAVSFRKGMRCNPSKTKTLANLNAHDGSSNRSVKTVLNQRMLGRKSKHKKHTHRGSLTARPWKVTGTQKERIIFQSIIFQGRTS